MAGVGKPIVVSADDLRTELANTLSKINAQIESVEKQAKEMKIEAAWMRDSGGNWILVPLLLAKTQALHALTLLSEKGN